MGRSILLSEDISPGGIGFAYNTLVFEVIAEGTRSKFRPDEQICLEQCYEDLDEMGLEYICLYDVDERCFNAFRRASEAGLRELIQSNDVAIDYIVSDQEITGIAALWRDLNDALRRDKRSDFKA